MEVETLNAVVANDVRQTKGNYQFTVDRSSEANPIDWYNAYFEVDFKLFTLADSDAGIVAGVDNANKFCTTTNGQTFIKRIDVECNGESVYNNTKANESFNVLSLLKYTKSYADTVGKDQFFYLDTANGTAEPRPNQALYNEGFARRKTLTDMDAGNNVTTKKIAIPLNSYSYFAAFKNNLHPNIKTNIIVRLEDDANIIFRNNAAANSKVIVTKFRLWCPKIIFNGERMKHYLADYLNPKKWAYLKEHQEAIQTASINSFSKSALELRGQDTCFFGSYQQQITTTKKETFSLSKHLQLVQTTDISAERNWK